MKSEEFTKEYNEIFHGAPWHGDSLLKTLRSVPFSLVNYKPHKEFHSIAELVKHLLIWRKFVTEKLQENAAFDIELNSPEDWNENGLKDQEEWLLLTEELVNSQKEIVNAVGMKGNEWFEELTPGKNYTNRYMLQGIISHDLYHLGQIRLLKKMAEKNL